jgi:2'-5' RNA ligase
MGLLRAFLACELPAQLQDSIVSTTAGLRDRLGLELVRWVPSRNIHLTLKFLGDVSPSGLDLVKGLLQTTAAQYQPFEVQVEGFGGYPNLRRAHVLWVGVTAPGLLTSLQRDLDAGTARLGYASDERAFTPHLTVGRVRQNAGGADLQKIRAEVESLKLGYVGGTRVQAIHLFKSDLEPTGSVYTKLFTAGLSRTQ